MLSMLENCKRKMRKMRDGKKITGLMNTENTFIKSFPSLIILGVRFSSRQIVEKLHLNYFKTSDTEIVVNRYLNFDLIWNSGVAFGFFSFNDILAYQLMTVLIAIIIIFLIYFLNQVLKKKLFFALVIGGAAGNLFDRLIYFSVPDFIDLHYRGFHWFTFNIADIFITIGIICILFYEIFKKA